MYTFKFESNLYTITFQNFEVEYAGKCSGILNISGLDLTFTPQVSISPSNIEEFNHKINETEIKLHGWSWQINFSKLEDCYDIKVTYNSNETPTQKSDNFTALNLECKCNLEEFEKFKEDFGYFASWVDKEIKNNI